MRAANPMSTSLGFSQVLTPDGDTQTTATISRLGGIDTAVAPASPDYHRAGTELPGTRRRQPGPETIFPRAPSPFPAGPPTASPR